MQISDFPTFSRIADLIFTDLIIALQHPLHFCNVSQHKLNILSGIICFYFLKKLFFVFYLIYYIFSESKDKVNALLSSKFKSFLQKLPLQFFFTLIHTSYDYSEPKAKLFISVYKGLQNIFGHFVQTHFGWDLCILGMQYAENSPIIFFRAICLQSTLYVYILVY